MSTPTPPGHDPENPQDRPQDTPGGYEPGHPGQPGQPGGYGPSGPPSGPGGYGGGPGQPGGYGQPGQPGGYGQPGQPGGYGQPGQPGPPGPPGGGYGGAPGQPGGYGQPGQPGGYGQPGGPGGYGQPGQPGGMAPYSAAPAGMGDPYGFGYGPAGGAEFASWGSRVGASLIDGLISAVPLVVGYIIFFASASDGSVSAIGGLFAVLGWLGSLAISIWNVGYKQGTTGSSIGKGVLGIKVVGIHTRGPIGFGKGVLRWLLHAIFNNACFLNVLWPLWDQHKQTWTDKVLETYVVRS